MDVILFFTNPPTDIHFDAVLDGNQQNPAVTTLGDGTGSFKLDTDSRKFSWDITYNFLDSGVTMAHIHGPSEIGENGGVLFTLDISEFVKKIIQKKEINVIHSKRGSTDGKVSDSVTITRDHAELLKRGLLYVNIHTTNHPDGEIRGQILTTAS